MSKAGVETRSKTRRRQASEKFTIRNYFEVQPTKPNMPLLGPSETRGAEAEICVNNSKASEESEMNNMYSSQKSSTNTEAKGAEASACVNNSKTNVTSEMNNEMNSMNSSQKSSTNNEMVEIVVNPITKQTEVVPVRVANFMNILKQATNEISVNPTSATNPDKNSEISAENRGKIMEIQVDVPGTPDRARTTQKNKTQFKGTGPQNSSNNSDTLESTRQNLQDDTRDTITEEDENYVRTNSEGNMGWGQTDEWDEPINNNIYDNFEEGYPDTNQIALANDELMENLDEDLENNVQITEIPPDGEITMAVLAKLIQTSETNIRKDLCSFQGAVRKWQLKATYRIRALESKQNKVLNNITDIEESQNENEQTNAVLKNNMDALRSDLDKTLEKVEQLTNELETLKIETNGIQRDRKDYNIKIHNLTKPLTAESIRSNTREDTKSLVVSLIVNNNLLPGKNQLEISNYIETAFRIGQPIEKKSRITIVKFNSLEVREIVMKNGKILCKDNKKGDIYFTDDLTRMDATEKDLLKPLTNKLSTKDRPAYYKKGRLYIVKQGRVQQHVIREFKDSLNKSANNQYVPPNPETMYNQHPPPRIQRIKPPSSRLRYSSGPAWQEQHYRPTSIQESAYYMRPESNMYSGMYSNNRYEVLFNDTQIPRSQGPSRGYYNNHNRGNYSRGRPARGRRY